MRNLVQDVMGQGWEDDMVLATEEEHEALARITDAYRGEGLSFEDDGSPEHDD